jgi:hypothetical protein
MLTEADMFRIVAAKYCLTESLADTYIDGEFIDDEAQLWYSNDEMVEMQDYDFNFQ